MQGFILRNGIVCFNEMDWGVRTESTHEVLLSLHFTRHTSRRGWLNSIIRFYLSVMVNSDVLIKLYWTLSVNASRKQHLHQI